MADVRAAVRAIERHSGDCCTWEFAAVLLALLDPDHEHRSSAARVDCGKREGDKHAVNGYEDALRRIASEDYRGNEPESRRIAREALANAEPHLCCTCEAPVDVDRDCPKHGEATRQSVQS